jgi:hypothetical protein
MLWGLDEPIDRKTAQCRMRSLIDYLEQVRADEGLTDRLMIFIVPVSDRNLLSLGDEVFFEGRKLGVSRGFDVTRVVSDRDQVRDENLLFDQLFESGLEMARDKADAPRRNANSLFIDLLIEELRAGLSRLAARDDDQERHMT